VTRDDALDLCTQTHTDTYSLVCDGPHATALDDCSDDESDARDICDSLHTDALDLCSDNYADANSQCASDLTTCQGGITTVFCSVCTANDGAAGEHDTVNDDVEVVLGGKAGDTIDATYAACSNQATPTAVVKCTLTGNDGDDTIIGSPYADLIDGGAGNDTMQGGLGNDTFVGGAGNDTVSYADRTSAFPVWVSLDPAPAKLWAAGRNGAASELDVIPLDVEYLIGGAGDDKLRGNLNKNIIHGGAGDDLIEGGADIDSLYGDLGNDTIYGGAGNDLLFGGGGTDNLYGGDGDDFLDATDPTPTSDPAIDCDGVNELGGTSTSQGGFDTVVKDPGALIDTGALRCEKIL
jgi:Ca2+-binding RTX toxin-like protein